VAIMSIFQGYHSGFGAMDIYMPEVNGLELTTIIRDHKEFVTIPIE